MKTSPRTAALVAILGSMLYAMMAPPAHAT